MNTQQAVEFLRRAMWHCVGEGQFFEHIEPNAVESVAAYAAADLLARLADDLGGQTNVSPA